MPKTSLVQKMVLRQDKLASHEWMDLIEDRKERIRPCLDQVSLQTAGSVEFAASDIGTMLTLDQFIQDGKLADSTEFAQQLQIQGIWRSVSASQGDEHSHQIVGLTREANWMQFKIWETDIDGVRCITKLFIRRWPDVEPMMRASRLPYRDVWSMLENAVSEWTGRRRRQFRYLEHIEQQLKEESLLISTLEFQSG